MELKRNFNPPEDNGKRYNGLAEYEFVGFLMGWVCMRCNGAIKQCEKCTRIKKAIKLWKEGKHDV